MAFNTTPFVYTTILPIIPPMVKLFFSISISDGVQYLKVQPENNEEPLLVEAEQLYEKILENITNKVVTNLSDYISFVSVFAQKELYVEQAFHPKF
jgi:hypothetical protein